MFTSAEEDALRRYCGPDFRAINKHLRGEDEGGEDILALIRAIDSAMEKADPLDEMFLFRGIDGDVVSVLRRTGLQIGSVIGDSGFMSVSRLLLGARTFAAWPPGGLVIRLRVPQGARGIAVKEFSPNPDEEEVLLPRGTEILVTSIDYDKGMMEAEII